MSKGFASNSRQLILATAVLLCFGCVAARLVWLHVIDRDSLLRFVSQARYKIDPVPGRRGDILDANGAKLATSRSLIILGVDPQVLRKEDESKWPRLAALVGMPPTELAKIFNTKTRPAATVRAPLAETTAGAGVPAALKFNIMPAPTDPVPVPPAAIARVDPNPGAQSTADDDDSEVEANADNSGRRPIRFAKLSETVTESTFAAIKELGI
jgi:cell division protein FtsI/penicillin-binding protein 2